MHILNGSFNSEIVQGDQIENNENILGTLAEMGRTLTLSFKHKMIDKRR